MNSHGARVMLRISAAVVLGSALTTIRAAPVRAADPTTQVPCNAKFDAAAALGMADDVPIVFAKSHVIEAFDSGVSGDSKPRQRDCHGPAGVTGAAVSGLNDTVTLVYVSEARRIDRLLFPEPGNDPYALTIAPPIGPNDRIEAIALNASGQLEAVVSTNGNPATPTFMLFDPTAQRVATPLRTFTSAAVTAPVSSIAFDARGELYAYDDDGAIVEFRSNASGADPTVVRTIAGPRTMLRPAISGARGTRPMTIDRAGRIVAGDDRTIVTFAPDATGDAVPIELLEIIPFEKLYGIGTDSRDLLYLFGVTGGYENVDRKTGVWIYASTADRAAGSAATNPIKFEKVEP